MTSATFTDPTRPTVPGNDLALFIGELRETTQEQGNYRSLVTTDDLPQKMGTTYNTPKLGAFTAGGMVEGMDVATFQQLTASNVVVTPGEVGLAFKFAKRSLAQWNDPMQIRAGRVAKQAVARKTDADLAGLASSFTTYATLGAAATVFTPGHIMAGVATLKGGNNTGGVAIAAGSVSNQVPSGPINGVFRWEALTQVMRNLAGGAVTGTVVTTSITAPDGGKGADVFDSMFVATLAKCNLYGNSNIAKDVNDDHVGLFFHKGAILYVNFTHDGAGDIFQRDSNDGRSIQLTLVDDYGFGVLDQNYAISGTFDATRATS
jgi:hypothetical protein